MILLPLGKFLKFPITVWAWRVYPWLSHVGCPEKQPHIQGASRRGKGGPRGAIPR